MATDVVVIGAGVIGSSVSLALARSGKKVVVLDRNAGPGQGSTSSSSAIIRFNYSTHAGVATAWESKFSWENWEEFLGGRDRDGGLARFYRTGSLCIDAPSHDVAKVTALFDQIGVPFELWDAATIQQRIPAIDPGSYYPPEALDSEGFWKDSVGVVGGYWTPDSGFVDDPGYAASNLASAAMRAGVEFRFRSTVTGIRRAGGRVSGVELADGTVIDAPIVVNVTGPHSSAMNALAGVLDDFAVSTRPLRVEVHTVPAPPDYRLNTPEGDPPGPDAVAPLAADLDLGTYFRGTPSGELLVGGAEPDCDPLHWVDDPDTIDRQPTQGEYQAQVYRAARRLPNLTVPNTPRGTAACYDVATDWIPIYDRTSLPGFYVAIGTSGNQFKNAPLVGNYVTAIIDACENGHDHDADPVRISLPISGVEVDLGTFSRRRAVHAESSFSVMG